MRYVQGDHLSRRHSREAEHSDLIGDVLPVLGRSLLGQPLLQLLPHQDDAVGHQLHVTQPENIRSLRTDVPIVASTVVL